MHPGLTSEKQVETSHSQLTHRITDRAARHFSASSGLPGRGPSATTSSFFGLAARIVSKTRSVVSVRLKIRNTTGVLNRHVVPALM
jgi:hypothetical protein